MSVTGTITRRKRLGISGEVAGVIRLAFAAGEISSLLGLEGPLRASLRADLCLNGWHWMDAHRAAVDIVGSAQRLLGAERPDWYEGQPDYVIAEGVLIERTRCKRCHKALPEMRRKYCSDICKGGDHARIERLRNAKDDENAYQAVTLARRVS